MKNCNWFAMLFVALCFLHALTTRWGVIAAGMTQENEDLGSFLKQQLETVRSAPLEIVNPENTRQLIYLHSTRVRPTKQVADEFFKVAPKGAIRVRRNTEFCQYKEVRLVYSDGRPAGHEYRAHWSKKLIDSSDFIEREGHENPDLETFDTKFYDSADVRLGPYTMGNILTAKLQNWHDVEPSVDELNDIDYAKTLAFKRGFVNFGGKYFYKHPDPEVTNNRMKLFRQYLSAELGRNDLPDLAAGKRCTVGEIRVWFDAVAPKEVSVIARQKNVMGDIGDHASLRLVAEGKHTPEELAQLQVDKAKELSREESKKERKKKRDARKEADKKSSKRQRKRTLRSRPGEGSDAPDFVFGGEGELLDDDSFEHDDAPETRVVPLPGEERAKKARGRASHAREESEEERLATRERLKARAEAKVRQRRRREKQEL